jgi:arylsulfatase A-like enzyme
MKLFKPLIGLTLLVTAMNVPAAETNRLPNILFALADDWSYGHAGVLGCNWVKTPTIDRLAQQGIRFNHAYTPNAKCAPSRACILTGRNPWQLKEAANHWCYFPLEFKTYAEALGEHGYFVGMTGKGWAPGVATNAVGKPRQMVGEPFNQRTLIPPTTQVSRNDYPANFEDFLQAAPKGQPWSFWFGCREPHRDYEYGSGVAKGSKKLTDLPRVPGFWPDNEAVRNDMLDYAYEVEHFDRQLGQMIALLEQRGELDNTIIIVTSDNGMPFPRVKGQEYEMATHLPLVISWKNGISQPGRVANDYISFIDFAPTFIELAGLRWEETGMAPAAGRSLVDLLQNRELSASNPRRDHVLLGRERNDVGRPRDEGYPIRGIVKNEVIYLHNFETNRWPSCDPETGYMDTDGSPTKTAVLESRTNGVGAHYWALSFGKRVGEELYDLKQDPECLTNLVGRSAHATIEAQLKTQLMSELKRQEDPRVLGRGYIFDEYPTADVAVRGFYERHQQGEVMKTGWINPSDFEKPLAPLNPSDVQ